MLGLRAQDPGTVKKALARELFDGIKTEVSTLYFKRDSNGGLLLRFFKTAAVRNEAAAG